MRNGFATHRDMVEWSNALMGSRPADIVIGSDYLHRWYVIPRNPFCNVYLHKFYRGDADPEMHDHPWDNRSYVLEGSYREQTPTGDFVRRSGDVIERKADALHRIEVMGRGPVITLFFTGPKVRDWGFMCADGWMPWESFIKQRYGAK